VIESVHFLMDFLPKRETKKYIVAMDNYFTYPRTLVGARARNVAVVGTARGRRNWPPKYLKEVNDKRFNTLYWTKDGPNNMIIFRWVDNSVVTLVSTMHDANETVFRERKRPRFTDTNKDHHAIVWGDNWKRLINIPRVIDDYNQWMGGVDRCDQLIAYYSSNLRCRRVWMPIMFHSLDIMQVNCYVAYNSMVPPEHKIPHKQFVLAMIEKMMERARSLDWYITRSVHERGGQEGDNNQTPNNRPSKRLRTSSKDPKLPKERLIGDREDHICTLDASGPRRYCRYCCYLRMKDLADPRVDPDKAHKRSNVKRKCAKCNVHLCVQHFDIYHEPEVQENGSVSSDGSSTFVGPAVAI